MARAERDLAEAKRYREQSRERLPAPSTGREQSRERLSVPPTDNVIEQRVLTETFCINRLEEIRRFAGNTKLKDFTDGFERDVREEKISRIFKRFLRENSRGDPPYFCVSATMMGRLTHTFKEEYVSRDKVRRTANELIFPS